MDDLSSRPVSRRGGPLGEITRPGTAFRGTTARPPSSIRSGTASRLATAANSYSAAPPTAQLTALGNVGNRMAERPITQHGLSGLSTSYGHRMGTASGTRQVKDKRYWQAILQTKIQEINAETQKLLSEKKNLDREKSARKIYEKKVKESAKELTNLQSNLTDMNLILDSFSSGLTRQHLLNETQALRERNEIAQNQLEGIFRERQDKDELNKELELSIENEKRKVNEMIYSLAASDREKYFELQGLADNLRAKNAEIHETIERLTKQKEKMMGSVLNSQSRMEAVRLQTKLHELTTKRNNLREEELNRLSPGQEREKLINEVRSNNQSLVSIGRQMKIIEDQLNDKKELLAQIEQDLDEGNSERHAKYIELKKRDEMMTGFLEMFPKTMVAEKQKMEALKHQITYAIEQMTLQGINLKASNVGKLEFNGKHDLSSQDGLLKEYKKLGIQLKQLQLLEKRTRDQLLAMQEEEREMLNDIQRFRNLNSLRDEAGSKTEELTSLLEDLKRKEHVTRGVTQDAQKKHQEIKEQLRNNENFRQISHLEEKLSDLLKNSSVLQEMVEQLSKEFDYSALKQEVDEKVSTYNRMLYADLYGNSNRIL